MPFAFIGLQVTSAFIRMAIAALLFTHMRRVKSVWDSSPHKTGTFPGLPAVVRGAAVNLMDMGIDVSLTCGELPPE